MKNFLRKVGLLTAAVMMMSSGVAYAGASPGSANVLNKWTLNMAPDGGSDGSPDAWSVAELADVRQAPTRGGIQTLKKNQKLYFQLNGKGTEFETINDVGGVLTGVECDMSASSGSTLTSFMNNECASAPLKIASPGGATICLLNDLEATVPDGSEDIDMMVFLCADDTCTKETSVPSTTLTIETGAAATGSCTTGNPSTHTSIQPGGGSAFAGQTIYVIVQDRSGTADTETNTLTVWAVGR